MSKIENLLQLIKENPDLEIVPMVETDVVVDDCFAWWVVGWGEASIQEICPIGERMYVRSSDEEELIDEIADNMDENKYTDEEANKKAKEIVDNYDWKKVIAVRIHVA